MIRPFSFSGENKMRYPNLRYGDSNLFIYYASWYPKDQRVKLLSRQLRRGESTIKAWLSGKCKIPWWVTEIIRLQKMEHVEMLRQMRMAPMLARIGIVRGEVIEFPKCVPKEKPRQVDDGVLFTLKS